MKIVLFILFWVPGVFAANELPVGVWHAPMVTADDGRWGRHYQSWLTVNSESIDHIYTLGAHYTKTKYLINKIEGSKIFAFNTYERENMILTLEPQDNAVKFCFNDSACTMYQKAGELPQFADPVNSFPSIQVSAKWCVDQECQTVQYLPVESEMLFNLYPIIQAQSYAFWGAEELSAKYNVDVGVYAMSYRLSNDVTKLESFATSLSLMGGGFQSGGILARSAVVTLKKGELITIQGNDGKHTVRATFYIQEK